MDQDTKSRALNDLYKGLVQKFGQQEEVKQEIIKELQQLKRKKRITIDDINQVEINIHKSCSSSNLALTSFNSPSLNHKSSLKDISIQRKFLPVIGDTSNKNRLSNKKSLASNLQEALSSNQLQHTTSEIFNLQEDSNSKSPLLFYQQKLGEKPQNINLWEANQK